MSERLHRVAPALTGDSAGERLVLASYAYLRSMELADAEADAHTSMDAQIEAGWASVLPLAVAVLADCLLERGDAGAAIQLFDETGLGGPLPELQMFRWAQAARGPARVAGGMLDDGIADLLDCQREQMGARASIALLWRTDAALALTARGDIAEARRLAGEQLELARAAGDRRTLGVAMRTLGLLSEADGARSLLAGAVAVLERSSARLEPSACRAWRARAPNRSARRRARASPRRIRAGPPCGSAILLERAAGELAASGARMRRAALTGRDALTPSERRVAEMAATGMSNPQIAQALFVTRKTIEMHLGRVYRKLEVSGRERLPEALAVQETAPSEATS